MDQVDELHRRKGAVETFKLYLSSFKVLPVDTVDLALKFSQFLELASEVVER